MNMHIQSTDRTPEIIFTSDPLHLSIKGESYPEDVAAFYGNVIQTIGLGPHRMNTKTRPEWFFDKDLFENV